MQDQGKLKYIFRIPGHQILTEVKQTTQTGKAVEPPRKAFESY